MVLVFLLQSIVIHIYTNKYTVIIQGCYFTIVILFLQYDSTFLGHLQGINITLKGKTK